MRAFLLYFCSGYVAVMLLLTGPPHLVRWKPFAQEIRHHAVLPSWFVIAAALLTGVMEVLLGIAFVVTFFSDMSSRQLIPLFGLSAVLGAVYLSYLRCLWKAPVRPSSCGCSPLRSPLSRASFYPAGSLALVSLAGIGTLLSLRWPLEQSLPSGHLMGVVPLGWAFVLAIILLLFPATAPGAYRSHAR